jgi:hypothetical protein
MHLIFNSKKKEKVEIKERKIKEERKKKTTVALGLASHWDPRLGLAGRGSTEMLATWVLLGGSNFLIFSNGSCSSLGLVFGFFFGFFTWL